MGRERRDHRRYAPLMAETAYATLSDSSAKNATMLIHPDCVGPEGLPRLFEERRFAFSSASILRKLSVRWTGLSPICVLKYLSDDGSK